MNVLYVLQLLYEQSVLYVLLMLYDMYGFYVFYVLYVLSMLRELCVGCAKYTGCVVMSYVLTVL